MRLILYPKGEIPRIFEIKDHFIRKGEQRFFGWRRRGRSTMIGFTVEYLIKRFECIYIWDGDKLRDVIHELKNPCQIFLRRGNLPPSVLGRADFTGKRRRVHDGVR